MARYKRARTLSAATGSSHQISLCVPSEAVPFIGVRQCHGDIGIPPIASGLLEVWNI